VRRSYQLRLYGRQSFRVIIMIMIREERYLFQRISVRIQRFNAILLGLHDSFTQEETNGHSGFFAKRNNNNNTGQTGSDQMD